MKIGIMTFHWATNHGAVIQAYALQKFLEESIEEAEVKIIDYYPSRYEKGYKSVFRSLNPSAIKKNYKEYRKDKLIKPFREKMPMTNHFADTEELKSYANDFDIVICGSDQIWNEFFTLHGEGKVTTAYYLSFCPKSKKIAYAASFGFDSMNDEIQKIITPLLIEFNAISVRENSAKEILSKIGIQSEKVCDPTFLLNKEHYVSLSNFRVKDNFIAKYILRKQTSKNNNLIESIIDVMHCNKIIDIEMMTVENWLGAIKEAHYCITNSFHCTVFSIIFHTPFYVIAENGKGSGMNDRLITLLNDLQLTNRIINSPYDIKHLEDIDWAVVDNKLNEILKASKSFIYKNCFLE